MRRLLRGLAIAAVAVAVLALPLAWAADAALGRDVHIVAPRTAEEIELERALFDDTGLDAEARRAAVIRIYGSTAATEPDRVVLPDRERLIRPAEDPELVLYAGEQPLQARSLHFAARRVAVGSALAALFLWLTARLLGGKGL